MNYIGIKMQKPLRPAEEAECFKRFKAGDVSAKDILVERNLRLVVYVVKKYKGYDLEELFQIGTVGLIKAVNTFKPEKGFKFTTYAAKTINNEILMTFRRKSHVEISFGSPIGVDKNGNEFTLTGTLGTSDEPYFEQKENIYILQQALKKLKPQELEVIRLCYLNENSQIHAAKSMDLSQSYISRIKDRAIDKLRKEFIRLGESA
jgi:RNA polymerase sporulation-specific sigma factor